MGRRKLLAIGVAVIVAVMAVTAWLLFGTDALIGVLLAVSIGSSLILGWLLAQTERRMAQTERRISRMESSLQREVVASRETSRRDAIESRRTWDRLAARIDDGIARRLDEFVGQLALDTREQTENLLKVNHSSLDRLSQTIGTESDRVVKAVKAHAPSLKQLRWETKQLFRQLEALKALYAAADPATAFPPTRTWAAAPDLLTFLYQTVRTRRPDMILECGSGVSTLVMAYALKANGQGRLVSLEHLDEFREITMAWAEEHDLAEWIDVRPAPLVDTEVNSEIWPWYSTESIPETAIDILLVDGPPGPTRENARFPALPLLAGQLNPEALVILDDYAREDESTVAQRWMEMFPELDHSTVDHEKGTALFETPAQWASKV